MPLLGKDVALSSLVSASGIITRALALLKMVFLLAPGSAATTFLAINIGLKVTLFCASSFNTCLLHTC